MKSALVGLGLLLLLSPEPAQSQRTLHLPRKVKGNVWYTVKGESSQIWLLLKGPVRHTETVAGNTLTVECSDIASAPSKSGANLQFKDGLVRRVAMSRIENGWTKVVLDLKTALGKYDIVHDEPQGVLLINVYPNPFAIKPPALAQKIAPKIAVQKDQKETESQSQQTPIVDLSALVRSQLDEAAAEKRAKSGTAPSATTLQPEQIPSSREKAANKALPWLITACVSLLVTLCSMIVLVIVALRRNERLRSAISTAGGDATRHSPLRQQLPHQGGATREREYRVNRSPEEPETMGNFGTRTVTLAEQYQRNQGDIELAMKLRDKETSKEQGARSGVLSGVVIPKKGSLRIARKLGVGAGEVDLLKKLRRMEDEFSEKETIS